MTSELGALSGSKWRPSMYRTEGDRRSALAPAGTTPISQQCSSNLGKVRTTGGIEGGRVRLMVVDDHSVVRHGASTLLRQQPGYEVVGEAKTAKEAVARAIVLQPDVVLLDISLGDEGGLCAADRIVRACRTTNVVAFSASADPVHVRGMLAAGAKAYVLKTSEPTVMLSAIRTVLSGSRFLDPGLSDAMIEELHLFPETSRRSQALLTPRESQVLEGIVWGYTNRQIAAELLIEISTVNSYRIRLCEKLGLKDKAELVRYGIAVGLTTTREPAMRAPLSVVRQDLDRTEAAERC